MVVPRKPGECGCLEMYKESYQCGTVSFKECARSSAERTFAVPAPLQVCPLHEPFAWLLSPAFLTSVSWSSSEPVSAQASKWHPIMTPAQRCGALPTPALGRGLPQPSHAPEMQLSENPGPPARMSELTLAWQRGPE